jgi:hypothetical protein
MMLQIDTSVIYGKVFPDSVDGMIGAKFYDASFLLQFPYFCLVAEVVFSALCLAGADGAGGVWYDPAQGQFAALQDLLVYAVFA